MPKKIKGKREGFTEAYAARLQNATLECADALRIIRSRETSDTLFYVDPPYYNSDMGHYDGYIEKDFEELLKMLAEIKGKFVLSSYPSLMLAKYTKRYGWNQQCFQKKIAVQGNSTKPKRDKIEVLTINYETKI